MEAVGSEDEEDKEVGDHHRKVESIGVINAREGAVRQLVPVMAEGGLRREKRCDGEKGLHVGDSFRRSLMIFYGAIVAR